MMINFVVVLSDLWLSDLDTQLKKEAELSADHHLSVCELGVFGGGTPLSGIHNLFWKGFLCILGDVEDAESEWIRSKVSIVEAGSCLGVNQRLWTL